MNTSKNISIKKNYLYSLSYQILSIIIPFITTPYISRVLGAEGIGIYSFTYAKLTYFVLVGTMGLPTYSQFEVAKLRDKKEELSQFCIEVIVLRALTMGISTVTFIFVLAVNSPYKYIYMIHVTALVANTIDITWLFQGMENFRTITIRNFIIKLATVAAIFIFVKSEQDLYLYTLFNSGAALIGNVSVLPYLNKYIKIRFCRKLCLKRHMKAMIIFFLPAIASVLISTVDKVMIGSYYFDKAQSGYYEQASKIEMMIFTLFSSLNITMRPRMAYLKEQKKNDEIQKRMMLSIQFVTLMALPISFGLFCISGNFVPWFFGEGYYDVINLLKVFAFWITFKAISNCILEQYIVPTGGQILATKIIWGAAFLNIALNALFIPRYSAIGAAIASVITEFFILCIVYMKSKNVLNIGTYIKIGWKKILAVIGMTFILISLEDCFEANIISTFLQIILGCISYFILLFVLKDKLIREIIDRAREKI